MSCASRASGAHGWWRCSAPSTASTRGRRQDRLGTRPGDRPAGVQPLWRHHAADAGHAGRPRCPGLRHAGCRRALLHLSHDHGLCDGGRGRPTSSTSMCSTGPIPSPPSTVQGAVLDADLTSFITYMPLPVRHGMTHGRAGAAVQRGEEAGRQAACRRHAPLRAGDVVRPDRLCLGAAVAQPAQARAGACSIRAWA